MIDEEGRAVKRREKNIKSKIGRIVFRRDQKLLGLVNCERETYILSRTMVGLLAPWRHSMLDEVIPSGHMSFNEKLKKIQGLEVDQGQFYKIFSKCAAFDRLAEDNYENILVGKGRKLP